MGLPVFGPARAEDVSPLVSPDRIDDVPATRPDPFPAFDNFAWRAFVALNWPALSDARRRGEPDRAKTVGDPGPRVWETFKSRYELFPAGGDGRPIAPSPWASYDGLNPCGARATALGNRDKTLASFVPFADFNEASFTSASPSIRSSPRTAPTRATKFGSTSPNTTPSAPTAGARAEIFRTKSIPRISRSARLRSRPRGAS